MLFPFILFSYNRHRLHSITSERFRLVRSSPDLLPLDLSDLIHPVWSLHHLLLILYHYLLYIFYYFLSAIKQTYHSPHHE